MKEIKEHLKKKAKEEHGEIYPAGYLTNLDECFTYHEDKILFWFNISDKTTKILIHELKKDVSVAQLD